MLDDADDDMGQRRRTYLFVCAANINRSKTAEDVYERDDPFLVGILRRRLAPSARK